MAEKQIDFWFTMGSTYTCLSATPYGQKTGPTDAPSRRLAMIIAQKAAQSLAAPHGTLAAAVGIPGKQQNIPLPLVIPLNMEMLDIVAQRSPQRALAEEDHLGQAHWMIVSGWTARHQDH